MLNMKKGLAIVLAAATALTFAPVASLGTDVSAYADGTAIPVSAITVNTYGKANQAELTKDDSTKTYTYQLKIDSLGDTGTFKIKGSGVGTLGIKVLDGVKTAAVATADTAYTNGDAIQISAGTAGVGTYEVTLYWGDSSTEQYTIPVKVVNPGVGPYFAISKEATNLTTSDHTVTPGSAVKRQNSNTSFTVYTTDAGKTVTLEDYLQVWGGDTADYTITSVVSSDPATVKAENNATSKEPVDAVGLTFLKTGSATLTVSLKATDASHTSDAVKVGDTKTATISINVVDKDSTFKIGDQVVTGVNYTEIAPTVLKTVYLTESNPTKSLDLSLTNPTDSDEKVRAVVAKNQDNGKVTAKYATTTSWTTPASATDKYDSNDLVVDLNGAGTVTATANALNATETYYDILVSNRAISTPYPSDAKSAVIRVITIRNAKTFTKLDVTTGEDSTVKASAAAEYAEDGSVKDGSATASVTLSDQDLKTVPFVTSTNTSKAVDITSSNTNVVAYNSTDKTLEVKGLGSAVVTAKASSDLVNYGNATVTVNVTVTHQLVSNKITVKTPTPITLTKDKPKVTIEASCPGKNTLSYKLVTTADGKTYTESHDSHLSINSTTGELTYSGIGEGSAIVEISGAVKDDAKAPKSVYVNVTYTDKKAASTFEVTSKKAVNLTVGDTSAIAVTGAAATVTYTSSDDEIASVENGTITAKAAGTAIITVTDPGTASVAAQSYDIFVNVKAAPVVYEDPAQVTGVKIKNAKGAKVTVTFTKDETNPNMKYYVQKQTQKKKSGKSIGSNKTTLSVKSGKSVKVRVKAYYYDENGVKHVGKYSAWTSIFKTDKK